MLVLLVVVLLMVLVQPLAAACAKQSGRLQEASQIQAEDRAWQQQQQEEAVHAACCLACITHGSGSMGNPRMQGQQLHRSDQRVVAAADCRVACVLYAAVAG